MKYDELIQTNDEDHQSPNLLEHFDNVSPLDNPDFSKSFSHLYELEGSYFDDCSTSKKEPDNIQSGFHQSYNYNNEGDQELNQFQQYQEFQQFQTQTWNYWYCYNQQFNPQYQMVVNQDQDATKEDKQQKKQQAKNGLKLKKSSSEQFSPKITPTDQVEDLQSTSVESVSKGFQKLRKGCTCKKSGCQKKYCECYNSGASCLPTCKCFDCLNVKTSTSPMKKIKL